MMRGSRIKRLTSQHPHNIHIAYTQHPPSAAVGPIRQTVSQLAETAGGRVFEREQSQRGADSPGARKRQAESIETAA